VLGIIGDVLVTVTGVRQKNRGVLLGGIAAFGILSFGVYAQGFFNPDLPHLPQQRPDLGTAAVHHDGPDAHRLQQHDVGREGGGQGGVDHGVAAEFDHHRGAPEPSDVGQGLDEHPRRGAGRAGDAGRLGRCCVAGRGHESPMFSSMYPWVRSLVRIMARPVPKRRSQVISMSRNAMWAATAASSWATSTPAAHTVVPP